MTLNKLNRKDATSGPAEDATGAVELPIRTQRLLSIREVQKLTTYSRSSLARLIALRLVLPKGPRILQTRSLAWFSSVQYLRIERLANRFESEKKWIRSSARRLGTDFRTPRLIRYMALANIASGSLLIWATS